MQNIIEFKDGFHEARVGVEISREGPQYVAYSKALDVGGYGKTIEAAVDDFGAVSKIVLDYAVENNTVDAMLFELGWKKITKKKKFYYVLDEPD